jgi:hypothetical protein
MAEGAECVMLNKGPFILEAVRALDSVLTRMAGHHRKKTATLRALHSWDHLSPLDPISSTYRARADERKSLCERLRINGRITAVAYRSVKP